MFGARSRRSWLSLVVVVACAAGGLSCDSSAGGVTAGGGDEEVEGSSAALIEGREVSYVKWTSSTFPPAPGEEGAPERARLSYSGESVLGRITNSCLAIEANKMFIRDRVVWNSAAASCSAVNPLSGETVTGTPALLAAPMYACAAEWALTIADSTSTIYVGNSGDYNWVNKEPVVPEGVPATNARLLFVIPAGGSASDSASWALAAAELARVATIMSTQVLQCGNQLRITNPNNVWQSASLAPYFASLVSGTMATAVESAQKASSYLHAAAKAQHATGKDPDTGRIHGWRHAYDSLLRAGSAYVQVPRSLYEPASYCEVFPEAAGCLPVPDSCLSSSGAVTGACAAAYPVVTATSEGPKDRRAEELLRDHAIDPRISSTRTISQIAYEVLISVNAKYRGAYANYVSSGTQSGLAFLKVIGIKEEELALAANRIVQQTTVLGRPIMAVRENVLVDSNKDGDTLDAGENLPVVRGYGTEQTFEPVNPWYLYANTETAQWPAAPAGGIDEARVPTAAYAMRGVFHALDYFRSAYRGGTLGVSYPEVTETLAIGTNSAEGRTGHWWCTANYANNNIPGVWECQAVSGGTPCGSVVPNNALVTCHRASSKDLVSGAMAYANSFVQGSVGVETCATCDGSTGANSANSLDWVDLYIRMDNQPTGLTDTARVAWFRDRYDVWYGEEGLRCALSELDPSGKPCVLAEHKFDDERGLAVVSSSQVLIRLARRDVTANGQTMIANAPCAPGQSTASGCTSRKEPFGSDVSPAYPRLYVTERVCADSGSKACSRRLIAGFRAMPPPVVAGVRNYYGFSIPVGSGIEDALMATLAADPTESDDTMFECGDSGMRRNVKLGLESELSQSLGKLGENLVEESWSHYLGLAEQAALEADNLGDDLVAKGLEMDMRAEDAREELENLCGGVIDVNRIRTRACGSATASCDIYAYLEKAADSDSDLQGIKKCLGITENANAVLGPYPVCMWQFKGLAPCECDPKKPCPSRKMNEAERKAHPEATSACIAAVLPQSSEATPTLLQAAVAAVFPETKCHTLFAPPPEGSEYASLAQVPDLEFTVFDRVLNLTPPIVKQEEPPPYSCVRLAKMRAAKDRLGIPKDEKTLSWKRGQLEDVAKRISVVRDDLNFVKLELDNGRWLNLSGGTNNPWAGNNAFPCAPHEAMGGYDCNATGLGASLLCGLNCRGTPSDATQNDAIADVVKRRQAAGERLAKAVETLRIITGTGVAGLEVAVPPATTTRDYLFLGGPFGNTTPVGDNSGYYSGTYGNSPDFKAGDEQDTKKIDLEALNIYRRPRAFRARVMCNYGALAREDPNDDYCAGSDDDNYDGTDWSNGHGTWLHNVQPVKWHGGQQVCIGSGNTWGYPASLSTEVSRLLPPKCAQRTVDEIVKDFPQDGTFMHFMDAGGLVTWPQLTDSELTALWRSDLDAYIRRAPAMENQSLVAAKTDDRYVGRRSDSFQGPLQRSITRPLANYTHQNLLDAFELACLATSPLFQPVDCETLKDTDDFKGAGDLQKMSGVLKCRSRQIARLLDTSMLHDVPAALVNALQDQQLANVSGEFGGQYAQAVTRLYNSIIALGGAYTSLQSEVDVQGTIYGEAAAQLQAIKYQRDTEVESALMSMELADNECSRATWQIATAVVAGTGAAISGFADSSWGGVGGIVSGAAGVMGAGIDAKFTCKASDIQAQHGEAIKNLVALRAGAESTAVIQATSGRLLASHMNMEAASDAIKSNFAEAQAALSELATIRNNARRAAAKILMLDNDDVGHQFAVNTAMRARMNTLRVRYETARKYAVRMTYLARRAIEQKIGMNLSDLTDDVSWVPAPSKWADTLCSLSGIDYDEISDGERQDGNVTNGQIDDDGYNYANQYVGDYVARLKEFVTAYENTYTSGTGRDSAVISLRDDVLNVRNTQCDVTGLNELLQTGESLNAPRPDLKPEEKARTKPAPSWVGGCDDQTNTNCVVVASEGSKPFTCKKKVGNGWEDFDPTAGDSNTTEAAASIAVPRTDIDCPGWGPYGNFVTAVSLQGKGSASGGSSGATGSAPPSPPTTGLASWYAAADCVETFAGSGVVSSCPNKAPTPAGQNRSAVPSLYNSTGYAKRVSQGPGGLPTLEVFNGRLAAENHTVASSSFTISVVYRVPLGSEAYFMYHNRPVSGGFDNMFALVRSRDDSPTAGPYSYASWCRASPVGHCNSPSVAPGVSGSLLGVTAPEGRLGAATIVTLVVDDGSATGQPGVRQYINGQLGHLDTLVPPPMLLGGSLWATSTAVAPQLSERVEYGRALSEADLLWLHQYLAGKYQVSLDAPFSWLDGDDMYRMRSGAQSPESGYTPRDLTVTGNPAAPNLAFDRGRGVSMGAYGSGAPASAPTGLSRFGASQQHWALDFGGAQRLYSFGVATQGEAPTGFSNAFTWERQNLVQTRDFTNTVVALVNDSGEHGLWGIDLVYRHPTIETLLPSILVSNSKARLRLQSAVTGGTVQTLESGDGVAQPQGSLGLIAPGVPFVLTLRSSSKDNRTEVWVNGTRVISFARATSLGVRRIGMTGAPGAGNVYMRGQIAQTQLYLRAMSDQELAGAHRSLAQSFGIDISSNVPGTTPIASTSGSEYAQHANLTSGTTYTLSWYDQNATSPFIPFVRDPYDKSIDPSGVTTTTDDRYLRTGWYRHWVTFTSRNAGDYTVGWVVPTTEANLFAAPQLEAREVAAMSQGPTPFFPTDDDYYIPAGVCEDREGKAFREKYWSYGCEYYCPPGLGVDCARIAQDPSGLPKRCYHQLKFAFDQERIEAGEMLTQAGFAAGNFNYRFEDVAVNIVGTGVKDCTGSETASTCYANNFLQYTLIHDGPFVVRNYFGENYDAPLYPGKIQQAKALLAERYLSNPLSGADTSLLSRYWDAELVGRPLSGQYTLRIYDAPGEELNWSALEDVQLVVNYRYWTRAN